MEASGLINIGIVARLIDTSTQARARARTWIWRNLPFEGVHKMPPSSPSVCIYIEDHVEAVASPMANPDPEWQ
jgi:hypothetical protein